MDTLQNASVPAILLVIVIKLFLDFMKTRRENRGEPKSENGNGTKAVMAARIDSIDKRTEMTARAVDGLEPALRDLTRSVDRLSGRIDAIAPRTKVRAVGGES